MLIYGRCILNDFNKCYYLPNMMKCYFLFFKTIFLEEISVSHKERAKMALDPSPNFCPINGPILLT